MKLDGNINTSNEFHANSSNSCTDISAKSINVQNHIWRTNPDRVWTAVSLLSGGSMGAEVSAAADPPHKGASTTGCTLVLHNGRKCVACERRVSPDVHELRCWMFNYTAGIQTLFVPTEGLQLRLFDVTHCVLCCLEKKEQMTSLLSALVPFLLGI